MNKIKLTNINPTDIKGGASLAGYRLHKALNKEEGIESVLLVDEKYTKDQDVVKFSNFFLRQIERVLNKIGYLTGLLYVFSVNFLPLFFNKRIKETDIFLIRNIHGGMFPYFLPRWLSKKAPVIWRFPDMWPLTGHCCYSYSCSKWKMGCYQCPLLSDYPALFFDTTKFLFNLKKNSYTKSNLYLVAPSKWMLDNLNQSPIFKKFKKFLIPIGIDTNLFKPGEKTEKPSLIIVSGSLKDKRKGGIILPLILRDLNKELKEKEIFVDIFWAGQKDISLGKLSNINNIFLGRQNEKELASYYAKSHIHILPTIADNLPNTIIESLSCGTPVVVFDVGGCSDAVIHLKTGYLADELDVNDFVRGIMYFLEEKSRVKECGEFGRELVEKNFSEKKQSSLYLQLIKDIYNNKI